MTGNVFWFGPLVIFGSIALIIWSRTLPGRLAIDGFMLKLPLVGNLLVQLSVAQAARSLATLLAGGITLVESWEIAAESITNLELRRRSSAILPLIREGQSFTESLETSKVDAGPGPRYGRHRGTLRQSARDVGRGCHVL